MASLSIWLLVIAGAAYASLAVLVIAQEVWLYELIILGVQMYLLLPALWFAGKFSQRGTGSLRLPSVRAAALCLIGFAAVALPLSYRISSGLVFADESSYVFQARALGSGRLIADAPPGATQSATEAPTPLRFIHILASKTGWYSKYPLGWPLVLAVPERWNLAWMVNPLLGLLLLALTGAAAREVFGPVAVFPSVWIAACSPFVLANCVGLMPHALSGVLIAAASFACLQAARTRSLARFALMFALLVPVFHVRPFTALIASVVLGLASLWMVRHDRALLLRLLVLAGVAAVAAAGSVLLYNRMMTGSPWVSPYALWRGVSVPVEVSAGPSVILLNLSRTWRWSTQSTLLYTFPFVFTLAAYTLWKDRKRSAVWLLAALLPALALGHLVQVESSGSRIGERYWFEGYFAIALLAGRGVLLLLDWWPISRRLMYTGVGILTAAQLTLSFLSAREMVAASEPGRLVREAAERYRDCRCVVFLADGGYPLRGFHLNPNRPDWKSAEVFYLVDPGPAERPAWAARFGRSEWRVIRYDPESRAARIESSR